MFYFEGFFGYKGEDGKKGKTGSKFSCEFADAQEFIDSVVTGYGMERAATLLANGLRDKFMSIHDKPETPDAMAKALDAEITRLGWTGIVDANVAKPEPKASDNVTAALKRILAGTNTDADIILINSLTADKKANIAKLFAMQE